MSKLLYGYDSDAAGQAATTRGLEILKNMGCDIRILQIYGAKDPDEFVNKYGPERLLKCVDSAISLVEFKVKTLKSSLNIENTNDKIKFLNEIAKILSEVDNNIEREIYIDKISSEYKISKEAIYAQVNKLIYANTKVKDQKVLEKPIATYVKREKVEDVKVDEVIIRREKMLIYILINHPEESYIKLKDIVTKNEIKIERNKEIIKKLYEQFETGNININNILDSFTDLEVVNYLSGIMAEDFNILDVNKGIEDLISIYTKEKLVTTRNNIVKQLENTEGLTKEEIVNLEKELNEVILKLAKIK